MLVASGVGISASVALLISPNYPNGFVTILKKELLDIELRPDIVLKVVLATLGFEVFLMVCIFFIFAIVGAITKAELSSPFS